MTPTAPPRSPLEDFLRQAVVDEYADVPVAIDGRRRWWQHWGSALVLLLIGVLVAVAIVTTRVTETARQETRATLADRVTALNEQVGEIQLQVAEQATAVADLQARILEESNNPQRAQELERLSSAAGATALSGPGLTVTIDDAPDADAGSLNRVLDRDLQDIVNALWQMGATGVSVNSQRLTSATAIRGAGEAILVNYEPQPRPYVIRAVGTSTPGDEVSGLQQLLDTLETDYGLVSDVSTGDVALPAGEVRAPRFATIVEEQS